jgi:hypothetical protein
MTRRVSRQNIRGKPEQAVEIWPGQHKSVAMGGREDARYALVRFWQGAARVLEPLASSVVFPRLALDERASQLNRLGGDDIGRQPVISA